MEVADKAGADVEEVVGALSMATDRLVSAKYLRPGMGDGGACHPRDNIAMSFLARKLGRGFDLFEAAMLSREAHTGWMAAQIRELALESGLSVQLLGLAYKAESGLIDGSPARLLEAILSDIGVQAASWDPYASLQNLTVSEPKVFVISTDHRIFQECALPAGSIVYDPWGNQPPREGVRLVSPGRRRPAAGDLDRCEVTSA